MSRVFFVNPPSPELTLYMKELGRCGRKSVAGELWPQTGLATLAAVCRQAGHEVGLLDAIAERMPPEQTVQRIVDFNPELCVIHTTTPTFHFDAQLVEQLRRFLPDRLLAMTGTHASALPGESLQQCRIDMAIVGEAEDTVLDILSGVRRKIPLDYLEVRGTWIDFNGDIRAMPERAPRADLDSLPFPARDLLPNDKYHMPFFGSEPFATVISSRGCPYPCTFCRAGLTWGTRPRHRSPVNVLDEIKEIRDRHGIRNVVFMTDMFTLDRDWVMELCERMLVKEMDIRWICNSRADTVDLEMLVAMKNAGCQLISYGLESGDQEILDRCRKGLKLEHGRKAIPLTRNLGMIAFGYFMIGLPGESWESVHRTIDYAIEVDPDYALFHVATPFPGTELYQWAKDNGYLLSEDWSKFDEETAAVLRTEKMTPEELVRARKMATRKFYLRPNRLWKELMSVKNMEELKVKLRAGWSILWKASSRASE